jgi:hypothetical protein
MATACGIPFREHQALDFDHLRHWNAPKSRDIGTVKRRTAGVEPWNLEQRGSERSSDATDGLRANTVRRQRGRHSNRADANSANEFVRRAHDGRRTSSDGQVLSEHGAPMRARHGDATVARNANAVTVARGAAIARDKAESCQPTREEIASGAM